MHEVTATLTAINYENCLRKTVVCITVCLVATIDRAVCLLFYLLK